MPLDSSIDAFGFGHYSSVFTNGRNHRYYVRVYFILIFLMIFKKIIDDDSLYDFISNMSKFGANFAVKISSKRKIVQVQTF